MSASFIFLLILTEGLRVSPLGAEKIQANLWSLPFQVQLDKILKFFLFFFFFSSWSADIWKTWSLSSDWLFPLRQTCSYDSVFPQTVTCLVCLMTLGPLKANISASYLFWRAIMYFFFHLEAVPYCAFTSLLLITLTLAFLVHAMWWKASGGSGEGGAKSSEPGFDQTPARELDALIKWQMIPCLDQH